MFSMPFESNSTPTTKVMNFKGIEELNCTIYEVTENQDYGLPEFPLDNSTFIGDTIYDMPKKIDVRVLVNESDISTFLASIKETQFSNDRFTVTSVAGEVFKNLKIQNYSKTVSSNMIGKTFYLISLKEVPLVKALVETYQTSKNAGYSNNKNVGSKDGQETKKTALKGIFS